MVKVCEVFGCTTTEKERLCMHKFPKKNVEHRNAWVAWITRNRPGWSLKCNSRVCELHFVPEDYVEDTRGNRILRRLKTSAIPSLQVEEIEDSENHCNTKTIRRFRQTAQCLKDVTNIPIIGGKEKENEHAYCLKVLTCDEQVQDCLEVGNTHKGEELQLSVRCLKDEHSDVTHAMKTIDNEYTSCSTPPIKHPLLTSRLTASSALLQELDATTADVLDSENQETLQTEEALLKELTASSALLQEDMTVSVAQKDSDNDCNIQLDATTADILDSKNQETLQTKEALLKELEEKNNIIKSLKKQIAATDLSLQNITKLYKVTKKNYFDEKKRLKRLQEYHFKSHAGVSATLRPDQIRALSRKSTNGVKWSLATITDALEFKFKWGIRGYESFVKRVPIYPTARTLQRKLQHIQFDSNILEEIFHMLQCEMTKLQPHEKDCVIVMDEMAIKDEEVFDPSSKQFIGSCTFPTHSGIANKVLVFLLAGLTTRWKYTVAYYFTKSTDLKYKESKVNATGSALKNIVLNIIEKSESIGLQVHAIISDMGTDNRAMWNAFEVGCSRHHVNVSVQHPIRAEDKLFFIPDPVHVFKNIACMLNSNKVITLPHDICQSENLSYLQVHLQHLDRLLNLENNFELKIAFRLIETYLHCQDQYKKMKVSTARSVFNKRTEAGLKMLAKRTNDSAIETTAFFINLVSQWFALMTNRKRSLGLSKNNIENYNEAIYHIKKTRTIFQNMSIGVKGQWKPVQTGVIMATESILQLQDFLLNKRGYKFVLTGRFTQDCLENLFSLLRFKLPTPNALQVKQNLKLITMTQISSCSKVTSYDTDISVDELESININFLDVLKQLATEKCQEKEVQTFMEASAIHVPELTDVYLNLIDKWEWPIIYDIAGAVIRSIKKVYNTCDVCFNAVLWQGPNNHPYGFVIDLHDYKDGKLYKVSDDCFKAIMKAEITFRQLRDTLKTVTYINIINFMVEKLQYVWDGTYIPSCHNIGHKILTRFFTMRLRMYCLKQKEQYSQEKKKHIQ
ncbi:uncharacterized protein [Temnothorax nylanderi]|uniref:uncharacterized protein isoform X2 n=1 Tax=Temnothorax nylanderi TaxID=102681 RepID=UPI003A8C0FCC